MSAPRLLTFGCRLNSYESAAMRDLAAAAGADEETIIVNTCAVTAEAERQARQAIRRAARENPSSANAWDSLAEALEQGARLDDALRASGRAVELATRFDLPDRASYERNLAKRQREARAEPF